MPESHPEAGGAGCGDGGWKAVTQSAKGLQEIFIQTKPGKKGYLEATVRNWFVE